MDRSFRGGRMRRLWDVEKSARRLPLDKWQVYDSIGLNGSRVRGATDKRRKATLGRVARRVSLLKGGGPVPSDHSTKGRLS